MPGIDFIIGGKDKASPPMAAVENQMKRLQDSTEKMAVSTSRLTKLTVGVTAAYAAFKGAMAALGGLNAINAAYDTQADAVRGLETALRLQGDEVEGNSARLQKFAGQMQSLTGLGDESTLAFIKQASTLGISSDMLEEVTKASVGLAEATGKDLNSSLRIMQQAMEGNFSAIEKQIPSIKALATNEEKLAAVTALATRGLEAKADASNTVSGMADRANGALGDMMESVGALIAPFRILISQGIKTFAESMTTLMVPAVEYAQSVLENIGPIMDWVKEKVVQAINIMVGAFTFFEVVLTNLDSIWVAVVSQAELYMLQISGAVMHALTVTIPAYAMWFAENFVNLIRDGLMLAFTVVTNHVQKIIDAFRALWDFIASGGTTDVLGQLGDIAGRSYLEGFESSLTDLPEIAGRKISEREKQLAETIGEIGANLGEQFATKFEERAIKLGGVGDALSTEIDLSINKKIDDKLGVGSGLGGSKGGGDALLQASESRLLTRGPGARREDLMQQIANGIAKLLGPTQDASAAAMQSASALAQIQTNTAKTTQLVPTP
jgi:hypothetical protein